MTFMSDGQGEDISLLAFAQYMREVLSTPQLTGEEEALLLQCIEQANEDVEWSNVAHNKMQQARSRLVEGYQPFVIGIAKRYASYSREMNLEDLIQEGNYGLLQALEKYDSAKSEASFSTWAYSWVRGMIRLALLHEGSIRFPLRKMKAMKRLDKVTADLYNLFGREPTIVEIARKMEITEQEARELIVLQVQSQTLSLYQSLDENGEMFFEDVLVDSTFYEPAGDDLSSIEEALMALTENERTVLLLRCGFGEARSYTQREVAERLGMKLSKVQKLDQHARIRLRRLLGYQPV